MRKWDELHQKERQLSYQLEEVSQQRFRVEQIYEDYEWYHRAASEADLWESAYQSRYASDLEGNIDRLRQLKYQTFEHLADGIDDLKKEERQVEDQMDAVYYDKQREILREEEAGHGH